MMILELGEKELEAASRIAGIAHHNQFRRDGQPYIMHPTAVQAITKQFYPNNIEAQILAVLHDVIEDGPEYSGHSRRELFRMVKDAIPDNPEAQKRIMDALRMMTHSKRTHPVYEDYLLAGQRNLFEYPKPRCLYLLQFLPRPLLLDSFLVSLLNFHCLILLILIQVYIIKIQLQLPNDILFFLL